MCAQLEPQKASNKLSDEMLCDLQCEGLFCFQKKSGYGFTTDAVLLANFAKIGRNETVIEFCSGSGVISLLVWAKCKPKKITCVEMQEALADMSRRSITLNKIENIDVVCEHVENFVSKEKASSIIMNPPYFKESSGRLPLNKEKRLSKFESSATLEDFIRSAKNNLKPDGKLFLVHSATREKEIILELKKQQFSVETIQRIRPKLKDRAVSILVEATLKNITSLKVLPDIIINNDDGTETEQIKRIYNRNGEFGSLHNFTN